MATTSLPASAEETVPSSSGVVSLVGTLNPKLPVPATWSSAYPSMLTVCVGAVPSTLITYSPLWQISAPVPGFSTCAV